jgi:hypothetical protein
MVDQLARPEHRTTVASTFVSMLIALAYAEMVQPVKASVTNDGFTMGTSLLVIVFFLTTIRVWIGNEMYLRESNVIAQIGPIWLFDFMVIVVESMIFVFVAATCSEAAARQARVGFVRLLLLLYIVDVFWVLSMWVRQIRWPWPSGAKIPWWWACQNVLLIVLIGLPGWWTGDFYSPAMLWLLTITHVGAFIGSVILYDRAGLLKGTN